ncbi:hypothetical protein EDD86DRAFT_248878 [Gorgonomyces haynaldii]|nr:hypothetical protein EDD86DRAFT_248878 [Gorgonomyces haynaldii]
MLPCLTHVLLGTVQGAPCPTYTVQPGDYCYLIAQKNRILDGSGNPSTALLQQYNNAVCSNTWPQTGQVICIGPGTPPSTTPPTQEPQNAPDGVHCSYARFGSPPRFNGFCSDIAAAARITTNQLVALNAPYGFSCTASPPGTRVCTTKGVLPDPPAPNGGSTCAVKYLGDPSQGFDGYCNDLAVNAGIDLWELNKLNPGLDCATTPAGTPLCVTLPIGAIPDPPGHNDPSRNNQYVCYTRIIGKDANSCGDVMASAKITLKQLQKFNPGLDCTTLKPGKQLCVSQGAYPSRAPVQNNPNAPCVFINIQPNSTIYNCDTVSVNYDVTQDQVAQWNKQTFRFPGCALAFQPPMKICVSQGTPPKPDPRPDVQCGAEAPPDQFGNSQFNCWCGTTAEFCTQAPPGSAPGLGCQGNCETTPPPPTCDNAMTKKVGYYEGWNVEGRPCGKYPVSAINPNKWTHLHYAFAVVTEDGRLSMEGDLQSERLREFTALKERSFGTKFIISVGGWAFNDGYTNHRFRDMASTPESRAVFIESAIQFLGNYRLDGLDIDWEYPVAEERGGDPKDAQNYLALVRELKSHPNFNGYSLSIAAPASYWYLRNFKIDDMHGNWDWHNKWVGKAINTHNNWTEVEGALNMVRKAGVPTNKITLGIGYYGRSFVLQDPSCSWPGCEFKDPGRVVFPDGDPKNGNYEHTATPGKCTQSGGTLAYFEILDIIKEQNLTPVGYDDESTIITKLLKAQDMCLGGYIVWSLDQDQDALFEREIEKIEEDIEIEYWSFEQLRDAIDAEVPVILNQGGQLDQSLSDRASDLMAELVFDYPISTSVADRGHVYTVQKMLRALHDYTKNRFETVSRFDQFNQLNFRMAQFQTGPGAKYFTCFQRGTKNVVPCPSADGEWHADPRPWLDFGGRAVQSVDWALDRTVLEPGELQVVSIRERDCNPEGRRPPPPCPKVDTTPRFWSGLFVVTHDITFNYFDANSLRDYHDWVVSQNSKKGEQFMRQRTSFFSCAPKDCTANEDLTWTVTAPMDKFRAAVENFTGIAYDNWQFGTVRAYPIVEESNCPMEPVNGKIPICRGQVLRTHVWNGALVLKPDYPKPITETLNEFWKTSGDFLGLLDQSLVEFQSSITLNSLLAQANLQLDSLQNMIQMMQDYEKQIQVIEDQKKAAAEKWIHIAQMIGEMIAIEIVTAGLGTAVAPAAEAALASYRAAMVALRESKFAKDMAAAYERLKSLFQVAKSAGGSLANRFKSLAEAFKGVSAASKKLFTKINDGLKKVQKVSKCLLPAADTYMNLAPIIEGVASFAPQFGMELNSTLEKRAKSNALEADLCHFQNFKKTKKGDYDSFDIRRYNQRGGGQNPGERPYFDQCREARRYFTNVGEIKTYPVGQQPTNVGGCDHIYDTSMIKLITLNPLQDLWRQLAPVDGKSLAEIQGIFCVAWIESGARDKIINAANHPDNLIFHAAESEDYKTRVAEAVNKDKYQKKKKGRYYITDNYDIRTEHKTFMKQNLALGNDPFHGQIVFQNDLLLNQAAPRVNTGLRSAVEEFTQRLRTKGLGDDFYRYLDNHNVLGPGKFSTAASKVTARFSQINEAFATNVRGRATSEAAIDALDEKWQVNYKQLPC